MKSNDKNNWLIHCKDGFIFFICLIILTACNAPEEPAGKETYSFERMWPTLKQPWYFGFPEDIAIDQSGNVYVTDSFFNDRIQKFSADGSFITNWGIFGWDEGEFDSPNGIAVDTDGNVYIADEYNHRIQKFTSDGTFIVSWGSQGSGNGDFKPQIP